MNRRNLFLTAAVGGAALAAGMPVVGAAQAAKPAAKPQNWVQARDGTKLYVRSWGSGPPIVFLSGWCLPSDMWAYQMAALSDRGFRCIAYDRRGHGRSDDPGSGYDYDTLADDLDDVLSALSVTDATVVAHSMSGGEVVRYMKRGGAGKRVGKILFLATTLPCLAAKPDNPTGVPAQFFDQLRQRFYTDFPKWIEENSEPFVVPSTSPLMKSWIRNMMVSTSLRAVIDLNKAMTSADFRTELAGLKVPTLFVHGDKDASAPLPVSGLPASKLVQGARLTVYEGAPHGLFATHMDKLNAEIEAFARSQG